MIRSRAPIGPVLREPRPSSTQESQLLFGHHAEVRDTEGEWLRVRGADGYEGWMHGGFSDPAPSSDIDAWAWDADADLSMGCAITDSRGVTLNLPLGAVVRGETRVRGRSLSLARRRRRFPQRADAIVDSAVRLFEGTYYQWGGITPWGADCSGMVQTVFALHGVRLLRDAWQQATQGVHVEDGVEALEPADLLFFSDREDRQITHVALAVTPRRLVHLALGRGGYFIEHLDEPDEYARGLMQRFRFARRIVGRTPQG